MSVLRADAVVVGYGTRPLLPPVSFELRPGELLCVLGRNGAGKSTLLRALAGLAPPQGGAVELCGAALSALPAGRRALLLAVVLTDRVAVPGMTVRELVALGRLPHRATCDRAEDQRAIARALGWCELEPFARRPLAELSDGERQRVLVARALAQEPRVLLLDEPTSFLDPAWRLSFTELLRRLAHQHGMAVLAASHDLELALASDRVLLLRGEGMREGAPEDLGRAGAFASVFGDGVRFDPGYGLRRSGPPRPLARVRADDAAAAWLRRALERAGFDTGADGTVTGEVVVEVEWSGGAFELRRGARRERFATLGELVSALAAGCRSA